MTPTHAISADEARRLLAEDQQEVFRRRIAKSPGMRAHHTVTREISDSKGMDAVEDEARWSNHTGILLP